MQLSLSIGGKRIEAAWHGPPPERAPTLVLLHEGLGSVAMWKEVPQRLAERTGYGVLASVTLVLDLAPRGHAWQDGLELHDLRFSY